MATKKLPLTSTQLEHILLRPDSYVGSIEKHTQTLWVYEDDEMVQRPVTYVQGLYNIFDEILVNAADNKQRDPEMNTLRVTIDVEQNFISVYNNGNGVPVEIHQEEQVYVPELIFGCLLTSSNYDDSTKKTTGGRNGYGAKLTNIFSTEFVIETADGKRQRKYKQVFSNNMGNKSEPAITKCKESENWTKVSFKPDLSKFNMTHLEEDVVALMKKRVIDMAGCLGKTVKVELNGKLVPVKTFVDYVDLYLTSVSKHKDEPLPRIEERVNERWEICMSLSEGQFQQVSFVNSIATIKGGTHVDYVTNQIANHIVAIVNKKNKNVNLKAHDVKNHLWVFVNALIDNPAFDSQKKENLTLCQSNFGSKCQVSEKFLQRVAKSGIVENLLLWGNFKLSKDLKKTDGATKEKLSGIPKLEDANDAGGKNSHKCTLILTEGDSAKALAKDGEFIELAISKKKIEARKNWLQDVDPATSLGQKKKLISFSDFINKELIQFSLADLKGSIPSMVDGFKPGQRKILYCSFKRNNFVTKADVAQFSAYVSLHSSYHHGEQHLQGTIIDMAQDFVGSNNVNLLSPNGQFGTRYMGGKDAAEKLWHIYTRLSPITRFLFPKDDDNLLRYLNDDGQSIEPEWYMPVIPTVLVNGSKGISTGWTTYIPSYNPRDIISNVRRLLNGEMMEPMHPWYRGFKGTIEKTATKDTGDTYTVFGIMEEVDETTLRITELPVHRWTLDYKEFLISLYKDAFIKDFKQRIIGDVCFEVILSEENMMVARQEGLLKKFKLTNTISTCNMHLFDPNGKIKKYDTPEQILEEFFHLRLEYYERRKKSLVDNLEIELSKLDNKVRFMLGVVEGEIIVINRKRVDLVLELKQKGFTPFPKRTKILEAAVAGVDDATDYDYLMSIPIIGMRQEIQKLCSEKDELLDKVDTLKKSTPKDLWNKDLEALELQLDEEDYQDKCNSPKAKKRAR